MMNRRFNVLNYFTAVIALFTGTLSEVWGKYCDEGHLCSPPKECCDQGCCYMFPPTGYHPATRPGQDLYGLFFYSNWYFWAALCSACALCVCICAWRRNWRWRCGRSRRLASDRDSAGSCYFPPQYSRCSSFQRAPPPPYTEVTTKPDLYPLVITYGENNDKGGPNYLMVQYFRNYVIRPPGSLSATSTVESLSSSFMCNAANETNTVIPPPYSCMGSFEEWRPIPTQRQALLRSVSAVTCHQPVTATAAITATTPTHHALAPLPHSATTHFEPLRDMQLNSPQPPPLSDHNNQHTPRHASTGRFSQTDDVHGNTQHYQHRNIRTPDHVPSSLSSKSDSGRLPDRDLSRGTPCHRKNRSDDNELLLCDNHYNLDNVSIRKGQNNSWTDNFFTKAFEQCNPNRSKSSSSEDRRRDRHSHNNRNYQNHHDISNALVIYDPHPCPKDEVVILSSADENHSSRRGNSNINSETSYYNIAANNERQRRAFFLSLQEGDCYTQRPKGEYISPEIVNEARGDHYTSGSDVSSVFNYTLPQSPSHNVSFARDTHTKQKKQTNCNEVIIPTSHITYSSDTNKSRRGVMRNRKMYMSLGAASSLKPGKTSPTIAAYCSTSRNISGRRSWLSRSAPTTPCGSGLMPNILIFSQKKSSANGSVKLNKEESNPLLNEYEESKDDDRTEDQML